MKKKILCAIGVAVFAVAVAFNIKASLNNDAEMDVTLAEVEALAQSEGGNVMCYCGYSWKYCSSGYVIRCGGGSSGCWASWQDLC